MNIINIKNLNKTYQANKIKVHAIKKISLKIENGEFTAIAGPSGSGKTTLLNMIGGLDRPSSGSIKIANQEISKLSAKALSDMRLNNLGFIFQAYNLIPVLTAIENVEYILLLQGVEKSERRERACKILKSVGLQKEINRLPRDMSGGQQQRVAVARAIVSEPEIILADEPTANLDQSTGAALLDLMHNLNKEKGLTFIFSTHDPMVMKRSERLINLKDGKIDSNIIK